MTGILVEITLFKYNSLKLYRTIATIIVVPFLVLNFPVLLRLVLALFLWRQEDTSSLRLLSVESSGRQMIRIYIYIYLADRVKGGN